MLAFIIRRVFQAVLVMLAVSLIAFILFRHVGDPVDIMLGQDATDVNCVSLCGRLGLDQSPLVQFWNFVQIAARGECGLSARQGQSVSGLLRTRWAARVEVSVLAAVIVLFVGL